MEDINNYISSIQQEVVAEEKTVKVAKNQQSKTEFKLLFYLILDSILGSMIIWNIDEI